MAPPRRTRHLSPLSALGGGGLSEAARAGSRALTLRAGNAPRAAGGPGASGAVAPAPDENTSPSSRLSQNHRRGLRLLQPPVGRSRRPLYAGETPERAAKRNAARGLRGCALDALAGDGGVGRGRVALSP